MTIAILGHGNVGGALARAFARAGYQITIATVEGRSEVLPSWIEELEIEAKPAARAVQEADILLLAVPFPAVESLLSDLQPLLTGKVVIDCTNPVAPDLSHGLESRQSGSEHIQSLIPEAHIAKCFSIYGFENFEHPPVGSLKPAMLIASDHDEAAAFAKELANATGWEAVHVGPLSQALHLEHMTLLWIKMVRMRNMNPRCVWALVQD
jgi:predicted dinucleotide-binding enzyme